LGTLRTWAQATGGKASEKEIEALSTLPSLATHPAPETACPEPRNCAEACAPWPEPTGGAITFCTRAGGRPSRAAAAVCMPHRQRAAARPAAARAIRASAALRKVASRGLFMGRAPEVVARRHHDGMAS